MLFAPPWISLLGMKEAVSGLTGIVAPIARH